jgi:thioester reductase-like protein
VRRGVVITGGNGFLGSYAIDWLLRNTELPLFVLVRAESEAAAHQRLWEALHFHLDGASFEAALPRLIPLLGDLHAPGLGLSGPTRKRLVSEADSVLHIAASLNRKSEKACLNTNLRGTLSVVRLAMELADRGNLARFTDVSTAAVAGKRQGETLDEEHTVDWERSDYDPYARTKKFGEHLAHELLPAGSVLVLRPSTVMGDSRHPRCWITDMVRAFVALAELPAVPLSPDGRMDVVPGDFVGPAIAELHVRPELQHRAYSLSAGAEAATFRSIAEAMSPARSVRFVRPLSTPFEWSVRALNRFPRGPAQQLGAVMKVFWPYITYDTVFDNSRVVTELGRRPARFEAYCAGMYTYSRQVGLKNSAPPSRASVR